MVAESDMDFMWKGRWMSVRALVRSDVFWTDAVFGRGGIEGPAIWAVPIVFKFDLVELNDVAAGDDELNDGLLRGIVSGFRGAKQIVRPRRKVLNQVGVEGIGRAAGIFTGGEGYSGDYEDADVVGIDDLNAGEDRGADDEEPGDLLQRLGGCDGFGRVLRCG